MQHILFVLAKGFIFGIALLPHRLVLIIGAALGKLVFLLAKSRRQVAIENFQMIYGDTLTSGERKKWAKANFAHLGGSALEIFYVAGKSPRKQEKIIRIYGAEHLAAAVDQGKGAVVFSAHMGNFYLMGMAVARLGHVKFLIRNPSAPLISRIYNWILQRLQIQVINDNPRNECAMQSFLHLRSGGVLGVLIDQVETGGIYVDFMGKPAGSTLGAANMALRRQAPLIPVSCYRASDGRINVEIEPEFVIPRQGKLEYLLEPAVVGMNKVVEIPNI
jgi:KDO2-lipid IV(A) lauroyltransferase